MWMQRVESQRTVKLPLSYVRLAIVTSRLCPGEREDGDDADAFGLSCVVGEAGVAAGLFGVDAVALVTGELANGDRVAVGTTLDRALADGGEVEVPVGVGRCASLVANT
jgi:hypothetical protein